MEGDVNYFGEVKLVLHDLEGIKNNYPDDYAEVTYCREKE